MDIAIIGACGSVGRQLTLQIIEQELLERSARIQLMANPGGSSETEMYGMRSDLIDAFTDTAPHIEVSADPSTIDADVVVMLAGATLSREVGASADRAALAKQNLDIFESYVPAVKARGSETTVIVQSNPVELGVSVFADELGRHRVLGAGSWNDTLRFRRELAIEFGVQRPDVTASMVGEHGSNMVPLWSKVRVRGVSRDRVEDVIGTIREGRTLTDFASEIDHHKAYILRLIGEGDSFGAYEVLSLLTPDLRAAVKPFFIHFTSGRTTEISTANSVTDILRSLIHGDRRLVNAQVALDGEWGDITGILGCQVMLDGRGWRDVVDMELADDETAALRASAAAIASSIAAARS